MMVKNHNHLGVVVLAVAAGTLVAGGMLLLMLLVGVEPAGAAFPGQNGKIAFAGRGFGDASREIYIVNEDGSELERLTNNTVQDDDPAWSPDGNAPIRGDNLIAFSSERDGSNEDIYTINPLGTQIGPLTLYPTVRLTNDPADDFEPAWSPDGKKIAFASERDDNNWDIWTMNSNGYEVSRITNEYAASGPAWSPDGYKIAFARWRSGPGGLDTDIYIRYCYMCSPSSAVVGPLTNSGVDFDPAWSPDGKKIAFTRSLRTESDDWNVEIYTVNVYGTHDPVRLTNDPARDVEPAWSPDGKKIAFAASIRGGGYQIYTMNSDGTEVRPVPNTDKYAHDPDWQPLGPGPQVCLPPTCD